jgi:hypothetical protein
MTKQTDMESTLTLMELAMREIGLMTCNMELEKKAGPTALFIRENTWLEKSTDGACTDGTTAASTRANGLKTKSRGSDSTLGSTDVSIRESGLTIICMDQEFIPGRMVESMKEIIKMIKSMDSGSTHGQMVGGTRDTGLVENSMVWVCTLCHNSLSNLDCGKKANVSSGSKSPRFRKYNAVF